MGLGQRQRLIYPQPGAPQHDNHRAQAVPVMITPGLAHDRDELIDRRRIGGIALALVARGDPRAEPRRRRWRAAPPGSVKVLPRGQRGQ